VTGVGRGSVIDAVSDAERREFLARGWWTTESLGDRVRRWAATVPDRPAYLTADRSLTWAAYDAAADRAAQQLVGLGLARGERVAVYLPEGPEQHIAYLALERAGLVIVGIPARAGERELRHLVERTQAELVITAEQLRGRSAREIAAAVRTAGPYHGVLSGEELTLCRPDGSPVEVAPGDLAGRAMRSDELWLLNSTSGTTGLPKCVQQTQNRWHYLLTTAIDAAGLGADDVLMSLVPGPFGFGLWSGHFAPAELGVPCVLQERFDAEAALRAVAEHRVTVLACVTTQFQLMLASPALAGLDLSSLRVLYTGGEAVPADRAREWERRTGSTVLQFYGSNEIGPFSCTRLSDPPQLRLGTVGRLVPGLDCRLYDEAGRDITASGGPGQPGGRSPGSAGGGYWGDDVANAELFSADGHVLMPDLITLDDDGYVRIAGRKSDIIIRGGKNISAAAVEADVARHPAVEMAAALPVPDETFGERVCAVVSLRASHAGLTLAELVAFLAAEGVSKEYLPEYLVVLPELPQSMGGKVAKAELRARLPELLAQL
jgi:acyl-CoA synthetase